MSVSLSGLVSGVNINQLISTISASYQQPITLLQTQGQSYQTTLSAWGQLNSSLSSLQSALSGLQNVGSLNNRSVTLSNSSAASATVQANAPQGTYSLSNIILAQAQSVYSPDFSSASNTAVGTGTLEIQVGSGSVANITINSSNNTLNGIAAAINGANAGVNAAVIFDGAGYRLTLTGTNTGSGSAFTISTSGATGSLSSLSYSSGASGGMSRSQAAQNASFTVNGLNISSATNAVSGAIPGVSLNLLTTSGSTTLTVGTDSSAFVSAVQNFVKAFNATVGTMNQLTAYGGPSGQSGPLIGNAAVMSLRTQLLNLISGQGVGTVPNSPYASLGGVGVNLNKDGTLVLDTATLNQALSSNYSAVAGLFGQVGSTTNSNVQYVAAGSSTQAGTYAVNVTSASTQASVTASNAISASGLSSNETLTITSGSTSVAVNLTSGSSISAIVSTINSALAQQNLSGISALDKSGSLELQTSGYGSAQSFSVVSNVASGSGSTGIGTTSLTGTGTDVVGTVNGQATSGSGQQLTVTGPGNALGLQLTITGQTSGSLGAVTVSQGLYQQMSSILSAALNSQNGFIAAAADGLNQTINGINNQITQLQQSAQAQTALLTQQFQAMQAQLAQLQSVGNYLNAFFSSSSSSNSSSSSTTSG